MKSQAHVAIRALLDVAATQTLHVSRKAAPIEKNNRLLTALDGLDQSVLQTMAENWQAAALRFFGHIDDFDFGQRPLGKTLAQIQGVHTRL